MRLKTEMWDDSIKAVDNLMLIINTLLGLSLIGAFTCFLGVNPVLLLLLQMILIGIVKLSYWKWGKKVIKRG
jgi:hypothetical protein